MNIKIPYQINNRKCLRVLPLAFGIFFLSSLFSSLNATHLVGGDLQYRCLGGDQYEIRLTIMRDCFNGDPEAIFDNPAEIWLYDEDYNPIKTLGSPTPGRYSIPFPGSDTLFDLSTDPCYSNVPGVLCTEITEYIDTVYLPYRVGGYHLAYQRCCRNTLLQNIHDPLETGVTYEVYISDAALETCNQGPDVNDFPELFVCLGESLDFDQSSFDAEGDEINYTLCDPYQGLDRENPFPYTLPDAPFEHVEWITPPYSTDDMMGNPADPVEITNGGILSGTPNALGTYLIGFCIEEYRDGILLSRSIRDFEVTVLPCGDRPIAEIDLPDVVCDGTEVTFLNGSSNADTYKWYFDLEGDTTLNSTEFEPTFNYPDTGCYTISLIAGDSNGSCHDTLTRQLCVYEATLNPDFVAEALSCSDSIELQLINLSTDTVSDISSAEWTLEMESGNIYNASGDTVVIIVNEEGSGELTFTVGTENGCTETLVRDLDLNFLSLDFIGDSLSICKGETTPLLQNGDPDFQYTYEPDSSLDTSQGHDPIASPTENTLYICTVTDGLCTVTGEVYVEVRGAGFEIIDLSDTCNVLKHLTIDWPNASNLEWSTDPDFATIISTDDTLEVEVTDMQTFYCRIYDGVLDCNLSDEETVVHKGLALDILDGEATFCQNEDASLTVSDNSGLDWTISWEDSDLILSNLDEKTIDIKTDEIISDYIYFTATAENGCITSDSILINVIESPVAQASYTADCRDLTVEFESESTGGTVTWDFGDGNTSNEEDPTHTYGSDGDYTVTLTVGDGACTDSHTFDLSLTFIDVNLPDEVNSCDSAAVNLNPGGSSDYNYVWEPSEFLDDANSPNPLADISEDTDFYVTITSPGDSCELIDTVSVVIVDLELNVDNNVQVCTTDPVTITATSNGTITWTDEDGNVIGTGESVEVSPEGTFTATTELGGCVQSQTVVVEIIDLNELITATADPDTIDLGETSQLNVEGIDDSFNFLWDNEESLDNPALKNPIASPTETTTYCVTVSNDEGCLGETCVTVYLRNAPCEPPYVFLPNAFSPNGDQSNDILYVRGEQITEVYLIIYDRWGEKVFESNDQSIGWDGTDLNGEQLADDVYGYYLRVLCEGSEDGEYYIDKGNITLMR